MGYDMSIMISFNFDIKSILFSQKIGMSIDEKNGIEKETNI